MDVERVARWQAHLVRIYRDKGPDEALAVLFDHIGALLTSENYDLVDSIMYHLNVEGVPLDLLIGLLSITKVAAQDGHLVMHDDLFDAIAKHLAETHDNVDELLSGLAIHSNERG